MAARNMFIEIYEYPYKFMTFARMLGRPHGGAPTSSSHAFLLEFYRKKFTRLHCGVSSSENFGCTLVFREPYIFLHT